MYDSTALLILGRGKYLDICVQAFFVSASDSTLTIPL